MNMQAIREKLGIEPQNGAFRTDNGVKTLLVGMDFGRDKSTTVICESRRRKIVARYDLPDDPHLRPLLNWFDEQLYRRSEEFLAKLVKEIEADIFAWIKRNPICYMNPCRALLDGICGAITPTMYSLDNVVVRYDVSEFFIQFPLGLPTELKGIAV